MKFIIILFGLIAFVSAFKQVTYKVPEEKLQKMKKAGDICAEENNVNAEVFPKIAEGTLPRDEHHDKYILCVFRKISLINEDGHVFLDKLLGYLEGHPLLEKFKEEFAKCNEITKENPVETFLGIYRCYFDNSPILFAN